MFRSLALAAVAVAAFGATADEPKLPATLGSIERKDPKIDALIPKDAKIEVLAGGFKWTEGPVWDKKGGALLFTDIPNNRVVRWSAKDGVSDFLKPSGYTGSEKFTGYVRQRRRAHPVSARRPAHREAHR